MDLFLSSHRNILPQANLRITGSKSESNRLLVLQAQFPGITLNNLSNSDDTRVLSKALGKKSGTIDIHHAGTAMRFLTAYFAASPEADIVLTGSQRMQQRPIGILVDALNALGADISYHRDSGFPPLQIRGRKLQRSKVSLPGDISSQYISALLLIAPSLPDGLTIELETEPTSVPYLKMTLELLIRIGITSDFSGRRITVEPKKMIPETAIDVESDWSSASYWYSAVALSPVGAVVELTTYREDSLQGDSSLVEIYNVFGVATDFENNSIRIRKVSDKVNTMLDFHLQDCPDLAQTIAVSCLGLGIGCSLTGLHTLKIKETDRLEALNTEIVKFGASISVSSDSLHLQPNSGLKDGVEVATYNDHRMAMAFAPLALKTPLTIMDAGVVSKSYPEFWDDLEQIGIVIRKA